MAAIECDAVVIQAPQWFRRKRGLKIYERFVAVAHHLDRSLAPLLSDYVFWLFKG